MPVAYTDLPSELRIEIYNLALPPAGHIIHLSRIPGPKGLQEPAIAAVNHQVRSEFLPIYYGWNIYQGQVLNDTCNFIGLLGPDRAPMLNQLRVFEWDQNISKRMLEMLDCLRHDTQCRMNGVRAEAVFVPVEPGEWRRLMDLKDSMLYRKVSPLSYARFCQCFHLSGLFIDSN